ncbi:MAG: hypothetical protein P794_00675 [Epsilonproteobacteria bacterium (ex Lamellibrachia satsuma)]|nr:MAG: hypothetical protein P794_00675 [Epsilonproteobacteria bacterium (ex Lamellibrachia satsuma)]
MINDSERELKFKDLVKFKSIEEASEFLLEKEIESLLRNSHSEQFKWMEKKFNIPLTKNLTIWSDFIEITERRNLFVHNNGIVSRQYIKVCEDNGVKISEIKVGDTLKVKPKYLANAYLVFYEIGFKLLQVLWRKLFPNELENADTSLINTTYDLLAHKRYKLAQTLLDFSCDILKKYHSDVNRRIMIINRALAYKLDKNIEKCDSILKKDDWSATRLDFQLAVAVLKNNDKEVYRLMKEVGSKSKDLPEHTYLEWPLFEEYREKEDFLNMYKEIFGKELELISKVKQ